MTEATQENKTPQTKEEHRSIPLFGDAEEPDIKDPAIQQSSTVWHGANQISFKLLRCLEAVRDITIIFEVLVGSDNPFSDKRWSKQIASPLYNLASGIRDMFNELEGNAEDYSILTADKRRELKTRATQFLEQVPLDNQSELRVVRDKIDAHIDKDAVVTPEKYWSKVNLYSYLRWLRSCLEQLFHLLSLDVYGWIRDSGHPDVRSLMSVDGTVVDLYMKDGEPVAIVNVTVAKSPKYGVQNEITNLVNLYNKLVTKYQGEERIGFLEVRYSEQA